MHDLRPGARCFFLSRSDLRSGAGADRKSDFHGVGPGRGYCAEVTEPGESFDQTGFELPPAPPEDPAQPERFGDDYSQPDLSACDAQADAADAEPVFWAADAAQAFPTDDGVQSDALDGAD